jgi:CBS-domain-containing membrane protein
VKNDSADDFVKKSMNEQISKTPKLVRDLMTVGVSTCGTDTPLTTIAEAILEKELEAIVVLDEEGHALGIVGQDELIGAYGREDFLNLTAEDILREGVPQIPTDIPLRAAAQMMKDEKIRGYFLMHHAGGIGYPAAVISYKHFLRHMAMKNPGDIKDLGINAEREAPLDSFIERRDSKKRKAGI